MIRQHGRLLGVRCRAVFRDGDFAIRCFAEKAHNITHWSEFYSGGHFPALEVPDLLIGDIREFFRTVG